jgi:hypothetical protein
MRLALRFLVSLVVSASIAVAAIPPEVPVPKGVKTGCCAMMKAGSFEGNCGHQPSKSDQDKQCCLGCGFCVATILSNTTPFVYSPTGEESFATLFVREHLRSDRPPVPPPRA